MIRAYIFLIGIAIITIGFLGLSRIEEDAAMALLVGSLTLGGGFIICGLFSIKMLWHGVIGAGVIALISFGRGLLNLPDAAKYIVGDRPRGNEPIFELAVTILSALLLARILSAWSKERRRKMLEEMRP
jgi:membrane-bound ClpP family serine protease